ncbi:MAG: AmmeMemoRadiSam system protein B [Bacteroidales bacterium]
MNIRTPVVAGKFYPGTKKELTALLDSIHESEAGNINTGLAEEHILGGVVPHAGYEFSGYEATHFFENIRKTSRQYHTIIIVNPSHNYTAEPLSVDSHTHWQTPLGKTAVNQSFARELNLPFSSEAGKFEHSGEVMLPFLQYYLDYPFQIVPITMAEQTVENAKHLAGVIDNANKHKDQDILLLASSDFSHFLAPETGRKLDDLVLDQIQKFNTEGVYREVTRHHISVCGFGPIMTLMEYARLISSKPVAKILKRGDSAKTYPSREVVNYVCLLVFGSH